MTTATIDRISSRLSRGLTMRGIVAVVFGVVLLAWPEPTLAVMLYAFAGVAIADGALAIYTAYDAAPKGERWWLVLSGIAGILTGIVVLTWPELSAIALLYGIGAWAIVNGVIDLAGALFGKVPSSSRLPLTLRGLVSVAFGVIMFWKPGAGALALVTLVAAFAIVSGIAFISMGREVKRAPERAEEFLRDHGVAVS